MLQYKKEINILLWIKSEPNEHEIHLFERGQKYIQKLEKIPGVEMIAIVNSLSMYATHPDSDIDLFIVTKPWMIWSVRFFSTLILWKHGVWRKGEDIRGNLCLSFFITTEAMDLEKIAIENDIYLYYWIYYMKPIFVQHNTYGKFIEANSWVEIDEKQKMENLKYIISNRSEFASLFCKFWEFCRRNFWKNSELFDDEGGVFRIFKNKSNTDSKTNKQKKNFLFLFSYKKKEYFYKKINQIIRFFLFPQTLGSKWKLWNPEWIIISDTMLKFHDQDRRKEIRDTILENNFDK